MKLQNPGNFSSAVVAAGLFALSLGVDRAAAGSIFLTGHDPDFHAVEEGRNAGGAQRINQVAIGFVMDRRHNPFVDRAPRFLYVESSGDAPDGHVHGVGGIEASGFTEGVDFEHHDASTLAAALDELGTTYSAIVVASDFGALLRQDELDILNAHASQIGKFLNAGGGLYAMAQTGGGSGLTPRGGYFHFLPQVIATIPTAQVEDGYSLTPYGASLGLTSADINGNFSHLTFDVQGNFNFQVVDRDSQGRIISLTSRTPEAGTSVLVSLPLLGAFLWRRRLRAQRAVLRPEQGGPRAGL